MMKTHRIVSIFGIWEKKVRAILGSNARHGNLKSFLTAIR
jgi:hypothetical protein